MPRNKNSFAWILDFTEIGTRVWGIITAIVLWGVGVDLTAHDHPIGGYILFLATLVTVLETSFAIQIFLEFVIKDEKNICLRCCLVVQFFDLWRKAALYFVLAFFCFLKPAKLWLASLGGTMIVILAVLYLVLTYKVHLSVSDNLFERDSSYDRFDDLQEELDDSLPEPSSDHLGDQNAILQV